MRCACTSPSSCGGVSQAISMFIFSFAERSFAAASAPVRAARKTGLLELLPIMAIVNFLPAAPAAAACVESAGFSLFEQPAIARPRASALSVLNRLVITFSPLLSRLFARSICHPAGAKPVGISFHVIEACYWTRNVDPDTRSLRSLLRDERVWLAGLAPAG